MGSQALLDIVFLKGLYFKKTKGKDGLFGIHLFSDSELKFQERYMFHR